MPRIGYRALRRHRSSVVGQAYLLTTVCRGRQRRFEDVALADIVARAISAPEPWRDARLLAWVLMPDHWHGLTQLGPASGLAPLMQRAKRDASHAVATAFGIRDLWQPGFHDRMVRSETDLRVLARFVVANPVRAGLVDDLDRYPFWGCVWGKGALDDPFC